MSLFRNFKKPNGKYFTFYSDTIGTRRSYKGRLKIITFTSIKAEHFIYLHTRIYILGHEVRIIFHQNYNETSKQVLHIKQEMPVAADKSVLGVMVGKEGVVVADEKAGGAAGLPLPYPGVRTEIHCIYSLTVNSVERQSFVHFTLSILYSRRNNITGTYKWSIDTSKYTYMHKHIHVSIHK